MQRYYQSFLSFRISRLDHCSVGINIQIQTRRLPQSIPRISQLSQFQAPQLLDLYHKKVQEHLGQSQLLQQECPQPWLHGEMRSQVEMTVVPTGVALAALVVLSEPLEQP